MQPDLLSASDFKLSTLLTLIQLLFLC